MTVERLLPPTTDVLDLVLGSLLRLAAHHESSRKIDSTFALPLFQGGHQFGAIGEPAVARIKTVYKERDRTERRALLRYLRRPSHHVRGPRWRLLGFRSKASGWRCPSAPSFAIKAIRCRSRGRVLAARVACTALRRGAKATTRHFTDGQNRRTEVLIFFGTTRDTN